MEVDDDRSLEVLTRHVEAQPPPAADRLDSIPCFHFLHCSAFRYCSDVSASAPVAFRTRVILSARTTVRVNGACPMYVVAGGRAPGTTSPAIVRTVARGVLLCGAKAAAEQITIREPLMIETDEVARIWGQDPFLFFHPFFKPKV